MKKSIVYVLILTTFIGLACGSTDEPEPVAESAPATPTPIVLATPTPVPPPPTPTPRPSPTLATLDSAAENETEDITEHAEDVAELAETEAEELVEALFIADDMILIPAGPMTLGQDGSKPKNGPAQTMELPAFEIDHFEVTNGDFAQFVEAAGYTTYAEANNGRSWRDAAEGKESHPVVYVNWADATAFCEWAGKRLPSEAEWEKAARGDEGRIYPWGDEFDTERGNFKERGIRGTTAVGSFPDGASVYGVEDMAGNVREWVADYFLPYEGQTAEADQYFGETYRVHRGGGWFDEESGEVLTTYNRNFGPPDISVNDDIGFRCARDVE